ALSSRSTSSRRTRPGSPAAAIRFHRGVRRMVRKWGYRQENGFHQVEPEAPLQRAWDERCPVCSEHDHVERVSALVYRESGSVIIGATAYPYMSKLAAMLSLPEPPPPPDPERLLRRTFFSWLAATGLLALLFAINEAAPIDIPGGLITI